MLVNAIVSDLRFKMGSFMCPNFADSETTLETVIKDSGFDPENYSEVYINGEIIDRDFLGKRLNDIDNAACEVGVIHVHLRSDDDPPLN